MIFSIIHTGLTTMNMFTVSAELYILTMSEAARSEASLVLTTEDEILCA